MRMFGDDGGRRGEGEVRRLSLVQLSKAIARSMARVGRVAVEGEVVKPSRGAPGWISFVLRDRSSQITVNCSPSRAKRCRAVHGERVLVTGSLVYRNERGLLRLEAEEVTPVGEGAIAATIAEARARLVADGLIGRAGRPLPRLPAAVGVVCGGSAAVRADIESVVAARFPGYPVVFAEVPVTGPGAAESVLRALASLDRQSEVEVVILARGGGDAADLLPFSDEELCRAIAECSTPVVSAIGHEGDHPLCDEVADHRFGTPSIAAAHVVPDRVELRRQLDALMAASLSAMGDRLDDARRRVEALDPERAIQSAVGTADRRLAQMGVALGRVDLSGRIARSARAADRIRWRETFAGRVEAAAEGLSARKTALVALDPARVLARGYSVVRTGDGSVVRSAAQVRPGDRLDIELAKGKLAATAGEHGGAATGGTA